jgi:hypothetical protein
MGEISASEVERVISALPPRRVLDFKRVRPHSSEVLANKRKLAERIRPFLTKGIDSKKIDKILADNQDEQRRLIEKEKAEAYKRLPKVEDTFRYEIDERFKAFELANVVINPPPVVVDAPSYIHATPTSMLTASHIQPRNSTAQIKYSTMQEEVQTVTIGFYFPWENSSSNPVLLANVASQLVVKGLWEAEASAFFLPDVHTSGLAAFVSLDIIEWWTQPPTRLSGAASTKIVDLKTDGWDAWPNNSQDAAFEWVFNSYGLNYHSSLAVPPKGRVLFEVLVATVIYITGGPCFASITVEGGDYSILCPFLRFEVTEVIQQGPPI